VIAWVAHILPRAPFSLFEAPIFYPDAHTLAYSEHMLVPSLMGAPLLWLGATPVLVHNVLLIVGLALSGWVMSLVVARWTGSASAGIVAGLLYGFNAHVLTRFVHLQAQHVEFFPLMLYALDRVLRRGAARDVFLLCGAFVLQSLCSNYLLVFSAVALVAAAAVRADEWVVAPRRITGVQLAIAGAISVALLAPFLWPYYLVSRDQGLARSIDEVARFSADWRDYLATGGRLHYAWWSRSFFEGRTALFPGVTAVVLAAIAIASGHAWRDRRARMTLAIGVTGVLLSLGPSLPGYTWLHTHVPLFAGLRNAGRWGWLFLAAISILAGFGVALVERRVEAGLKTRLYIAVLLCALVTAEAMRTPLTFTPFGGIPRIYDVVAQQPNAVLAEFPLFSGIAVSNNGPYMVNATRHWKPLVNGYSGFQPRTFESRGARLEHFPDAVSVAELRSLGVTHVTVHTAAFAQRSGGDALRAVEGSADLELVSDQDGDQAVPVAVTGRLARRRPASRKVSSRFEKQKRTV
jgi:hypothetical protein